MSEQRRNEAESRFEVMKILSLLTKTEALSQVLSLSKVCHPHLHERN